MKYILHSLILLLSSLSILACGSAGTTGEVSSGVTISSTKSTLTANKKIMSMDLTLNNNYSPKVTVQVKDLALDVAPCQVLNSDFMPNEFTFVKSSTVKVRAELTFYDECTPTNYKLKGTTVITLDGQTREIALDFESQEFNASIATDIASGYDLSVSTKDDDFNMGIPDIEKTFSVDLKDINGELLNDDFEITKIEVLTENAVLIKILDNETGEAKNSLLLENKNNSSFTLVSKKLSGIAPIRVDVDFIDTNKKAKSLSTLISIPVKSGPPSAISISYVSTGHDESRAKYEEKFAVSVTDEYGNRVNTKPYISLGAIVGYAVDGRESSSVESEQTRRLYYGQSDIESSIANGTVNPLGDSISNTTNFEDTTGGRSNVFKWVNAEGANSDKLVVFGKGKNYEAMGKWDFSKLNDNTLTLEDDYFGQFRSNLSYAIGRNYYQDQCTDDSREWLGTTDSESYQLDDEGTVIVSYKYDYHLMGKDALVWVNLNGYQSDTQKTTRLGEVTKHTLFGQGLRRVPEGSISLDSNETKSITYEIWHEGSPNTPYRNAHFAWREAPGNDCEIISTVSSNEVDARTCDNGWSREGRSYMTFVLASSADKGCSFEISDLLMNDEF
jgi:hypothetical protein